MEGAVTGVGAVRDRNALLQRRALCRAPTVIVECFRQRVPVFNVSAPMCEATSLVTGSF